MSAAILMYHRVCPADRRSTCHFARGTAIRPDTFGAQLDRLGSRFRFVSLLEALSGAVDGPVCALTFDDGYRDIVDVVWPACRARGIPIAVFPVVRHSGGAPAATWFDRYYDVLHRATRRSGLSAGMLRLEADQPVPAIDADLHWWIRGPLKRRLAALDEPAFAAALHELRTLLAAPPEADLAAELYLRHDELHSLCRQGVLVGGHGATHRRLDQLSSSAALAEMQESARLLDDLAVTGPRVFCYPDGGVPAGAAELLDAAGFSFGLTVESGEWHRRGDRSRVPRFLLRQTTTNDDLDAMCRRVGDSICSPDYPEPKPTRSAPPAPASTPLPDLTGR